MALLSLPTELIQRIVHETIPEDFEHVVLACKQLHVASSVFLQQYNLRRKRYRHFSLSIFRIATTSRSGRDRTGVVHWDTVTEATGIKIKSVPDLLLHIAEDPVIARYIQTLNIKDDNYYHDPLRKDLDDAGGTFYPHVKDNPGPLCELVRHSPYLREAGVDLEKWITRMIDDEWMTKYMDSNAARDTALLLTLLPNVTELAPDQDWGRIPDSHKDPELWQVLDVIVRWANDKSLPSASLSRLEVVKPSVGIGYERRRGLSSSAPFLALNSVREFYAGSCIFYADGYTGFPFDPRYETYGANLEKIELVGSVARFRELGELLSRAPQLRCFHFAYETKWHGCGHNWNVGAFINAIQENVGDTLEELSITILHCYGGRGTTLDDMTGFKRLKALELDVNMLMAPAFNKFSKNEEWLDEEGPPGDAAMPRLVDMLPSSIEAVRLFNQEYNEKQMECVRALFKGLQEEQSMKLPHLQLVELVSPETETETSVDALQTLAAVRDAGGKVVLRTNARACHPQFAVTFLERFGVDDW
ncbi:putative f-box domain protein [Phaeoacremonium minimum UCRPA7]|uniref:Putative f-box domain protein n=1 Tax=Phaeoacremonium minimum (strain UCR-PA7) TaxID=1286976 RepID=R8BAD1_PHAM7|nr:putative f-box domain protein [Phaeoacremonium minimum UCRPA7]EON96232.1 putative f-box domain protein [Phaeoacremonium minimum UCRPA7]